MSHRGDRNEGALLPLKCGHRLLPRLAVKKPEFRASRTSLGLLRRLCVPRRLIRKKGEKNFPETRETEEANPGLGSAPHRILEFTITKVLLSRDWLRGRMTS